MANYLSLAELLDTTQGMTVIVSNTGHDDDTVQCAGVDWFRFGNVPATTIYASGNSFFGFGAAAEQLRVCRRDGKMWYLYRQEGTLYGCVRFLKLRWQGYANYGSTASSYALRYEIFLFEDGRMFLNVVQTPVADAAAYLGVSSLTCGAATYAMTVGTADTCPVYYTFTPTDETGTAWTVAPERITLTPPYARKYLVQADDVYYTERDGALAAVTPTGTLSELFRSCGMDALPDGALLVPLANPTVLAWYDTDCMAPVLAARVTGVPRPQTLCATIDLASRSILGIAGIEAVYEGVIRISTSADHGATWTEPAPLEEFAAQDTDALWAGLQDTRCLLLRITLYPGALFTKLRFTYIN